MGRLDRDWTNSNQFHLRASRCSVNVDGPIEDGIESNEHRLPYQPGDQSTSKPVGRRRPAAGCDEFFKITFQSHLSSLHFAFSRVNELIVAYSESCHIDYMDLLGYM